jgi:hypothetical protein
MTVIYACKKQREANAIAGSAHPRNSMAAFVQSSRIMTSRGAP